MTRAHAALAIWSAEWRRRRLLGGLAAGCCALLLAAAGYVADLDPGRLVGGIPAALRYFASTVPDVPSDGVGAGLADWFWGWRRWSAQLLDTLVIAFLATLMGYIVALPLSLVAARNLAPARWARFGAKRFLQAARTVPDLVFALVFVVAFGLGPLAGVLALGLHSAGALGKLFTGVNENVDAGPLEGVRASGGNWVQTMRFGALPQVQPGLLSYTLLRLEINVRSAAVLGFVGVGGIGQELYTAVRQFIYADVGAILLMIITTVVLIDHLGDWLRGRLRSGEGADEHAF